MRLHRAFTALAALLALAACGENAVQDLSGPAPAAQIRFFNFGVGSPAVHFYDGTTKLTASTSATCQAAKNPPVTATDSMCLATGAEATAGIGYGGVSTGGWYMGIDAGQHTLQGRLMSGADKGTAISSLPATIAAGKIYSFFQSGIYSAATKTVDAFIVEDNFPAQFDWSTAYIRFVNTIGNSQPLMLTATNTVTGQVVAIGGATAYKGATDFVKIAPGAYDFAASYAGGVTKIVRANLGLEPGFVYTIAAIGDITVTSTTAATRPQLDITRSR
ncbi:MAG TPA: hypothetical protein VGD77_05815 [Gemmatimonadaceae bacterium]